MSISAEDLSQAVNQVVSETFEGMAFLEVCPAPEPPPEQPADENWIWARIGIQNPYRGIIAVACAKDFVEEVARGMYSEIEEQELKQKVADTLGEIANTIAGKLMSLLVPDKNIFTLGLPETGKGLSQIEAENRLYFLTDEGQIILVGVSLRE